MRYVRQHTRLQGTSSPVLDNPAAQLPDDPSQEILPVAQPQPAPTNGVPVRGKQGARPASAIHGR